MSRQSAALLLIDFINAFDFAGGAELARRALPAAQATAALRIRAYRESIPVIFVNDNFGRWRSSFEQVVRRCAGQRARGRAITKLLAPRRRDHFVLKPKNSAFYDTPLATLLRLLGIKRLILTGLAADNCVQFTANDAHLRGFPLWIPEGCIAAETCEREREALGHFSRVLGADIRSAAARHL